jgi:transportin-3
MSAAFGIASIVQAVHTLYAPLTTDDVRRQADQYLQSFQADSSAWQTGHELLTAAALPGADPTRMHELRFFAAQTMHTKFKYDFAQLPGNLHEQMRSVVLGYLTQFKDAGAPLRPQIALVVAALTVQLSTWQQPVESLIAQFGNDATALILLDVLCELPEECRSDRTVITADARRSARAKMTVAAPQVLQLLNMYLQMTGNNRQLQAQVLRCLASWAEFGGFPADQLATNPLLALTFQALQVPDLICPARDCICQFIYSCRDMAKSAPLVGVLIPNILQLGPLFGINVLFDDFDFDQCLIFFFSLVLYLCDCLQPRR